MLIVVHYAEIALKGGNRRFFEEKLAENIKKSLKNNGIVFEYVKIIYGRILVKLQEADCPVAVIATEHSNCNLSDQEAISSLKNVFGIAYFAFVYPIRNTISNGADVCELALDKIEKKAVEIFQTKKFKTFRIETKRGNKNFPLTSQEVNERVGEVILHKVKSQKSKVKIKVKLENPDITLFIEIIDKNAFLYTEKIPGPGGLPVGISGRAVSLISGGIDSPVASFLAMKRGIKLVFVHFHAVPYADKRSIEKVRDIVKMLNVYQNSAKLYLIPFADIQKEILLKTQAKYRVILYRRFMLCLAEKIAQKEKAEALITGENIGQVASQTLPNMSVISQAIKMPILRPLLCEDKQDIIEKAKKIGTFTLSILPHQDCCSRFLPAHPATNANLKQVLAEEKKLNIKKLIASALKSSTIENI